MIARENPANVPPAHSSLCLCNCCGKLHSNCPFQMSMVEDMIEEVKKRPELWLSTHPKFKHNRHKGRLWNAIAAKLNTDSDILKKHWKYLKCSFKKELNKLSDISSNGGEQPVSSWQYFEQMSFLKEEFEESSSDMSTSITREEIVVSGELPLPMMGENELPFSDLQPNHLQENSEAGSMPSLFQGLEDNHISTLPIPSMPSTSSTPRFSVESQPKNTMKPEYSKSQFMMTEMRPGNDEDFFYLMSILPNMRRLTHVQKMRFRSKIEQFLLEAVTINEYSTYMNNFSPNSSLPAQGNRKRNSRRACI